MRIKIKISIILLLSMFSLVSCNKRKKILLPKIEGVSLKNIEDYSTIYVFYDEANQIYQINKNNLISSTNWVFNIDRRLNFAQVAEVLDLMQTKKESPNIHSRLGSQNYFSVADMSDKTLSFINFSKTRFYTFLKSSNQNIVRVCSENKVIFHKKKYTLKDFLKYSYTNQIIWSFDSDMSFNDFLYIYQILTNRGVVPKAIFVSS